MILTLAEAAIGAGAVLEAPADLAHAGALTVSGYSIDSAYSGPRANSSLPCVASGLTATIFLRPR